MIIYTVQSIMIQTYKAHPWQERTLFLVGGLLKSFPINGDKYLHGQRFY